MIHKLLLVITAIGCLLTSSCSNDDSFFVSGEVTGNPTMNLKAVYYGNDALQTVITPVKDGKFEFFGQSRTYTIVELYDNDYTLLGRLYIKNGEKATCRIDRNNPYKISVDGNETNIEWTNWLTKNEKKLREGKPQEINNLVKKYVTANHDKVTSSLLILTLFDASTEQNTHLADSLLSILKPEARPQSLLGSYTFFLQRVADSKATDAITSLTFTTRTDSIFIFSPNRKPFTLFAFSDESSNRQDSIVPMLKKIRKNGAAKIDIIDFSLDTDTFTWARIVRPDSATWTQAWRPGGVMARGVDRLKLPVIPYFIVTDSTGKQLLRTPSAFKAERFLMNII